MSESDRRPGESDRDYYRRLAQIAAQQEQERKDRERQASLDATAEAAEIREALGDEMWLNDFAQSQLGLTIDEVQSALAWGTQNQGKIQNRDKDALAAYAAAEKTYGKKRRNKRVAKAIKKHKKSIQGMDKKRKSGWGCAVIGVALLGAFGGAGWGLFEAGSAIVSAMGH